MTLGPVSSCYRLNEEESASAARKAALEVEQRRRDLEAQHMYQADERVGIPWNQDTMATLTDLYQITMAYAYWKSNKHERPAVFEVFFRTSPFKGEFTVLAGINDVIRFVNTFRFDEVQIRYLKEMMPTCDPNFFNWLATLDSSPLTIYAIREGSLVFPREPLLRVEGPLALCQLLETTVLTLMNFASLVATNAARYRLAAGFDKGLLEFGLRRAQGPDGGMSASRYSFVGGFDATSNVRAGFLFGIPCKGTHAHAYVTSFHGLQDLRTRHLDPADPGASECEFVDRVEQLRDELQKEFENKYCLQMHEGELAAFTAYAQAFPTAFMALVDTYDVMLSGVPNYCIVASALLEWGYTPLGIRLDSGDLAYLSKWSRDFMDDLATFFKNQLHQSRIVASNSINEDVLQALSQQTHAIDTFGIGTHLVTCYNQPALGMVYKLCEVDGQPTMKISQEIAKTSLPYPKEVYRLYDRQNMPILDIIDMKGEPGPAPGDRVFCQHILEDSKRCFVMPSRVEKLLKCVWRNGKATRHILGSNLGGSEPPADCSGESDSADRSVGIDEEDTYDGRCHLAYLTQCRRQCLNSLRRFRQDHLRFNNPTPYKISATRRYFEKYRSLWDNTAPIRTYE